jgi:beta-lactamase regulating signal transducer with metallopeptidase domain
MLITWIVAFMVHSTVLLAAAWLVSRALQGRPRASAALWRAALVAPLLTATVQVWTQPQTAWRWSLTEPSVARVESGVAPMLDDTTWALAVPALADSEPFPAILTADLDRVVDTTDAEPALAAPAAVLEVAPPDEPAPTSWSWAELLGVLWVLGVLLGLAGIVAGALRLRWELTGRRPLVAPWGPHELEAPRVGLAIAPRLRVPLVHGVWRPEVCVPTRALLELDADALRAVVAHELGHVVHRDPLWRWIGLVLERVLFFQPLLRVANRELAAASELLADAWAVGRTRRPLALAESLTVVAGWVQPRALPSAAPAMADRRSQLWRRVERLVDADVAGVVDPRPRWLAPGLTIAVAGLVAFAPGVDAQAMCPRAKAGFEFDAHAAWVQAAGEDGPTIVVLQGDDFEEDADAEAPADDRKARRATAKERRQAKKRVKKAFKRARKRGEVPSDEELVVALHGKKRKAKSADGAVVVMIRDDGRKTVVRVDPRALQQRAVEMERHMRDAERQLRQEQRRLEQRARAIEQLLEAERRGHGNVDWREEYLRQLERAKKHKHKHKNKHKGEHPGRGHGWGRGGVVHAPPAPPAPPAAHPGRAPRPPGPPRALHPGRPPRPPAPPAEPRPPGLVRVGFD